MESKSCVLHYFKGLYARAEPVRLMLSFLNISWQQKDVEDIKFPSNQEQWDAIRFNFNFLHLPILQRNGKILKEPRTIIRALSLESELYPPEDPYTLWKVESLIDHFSDVEWEYLNAHFSPNRDEKMEQFLKKHEQWTFQVLENRLKQNSSQDFLVGDKLTPPDCLYASLFWTYLLNENYPDEQKEPFLKSLSDYPILWGYLKKSKERFPRLSNRPPSLF